MAAAIRVLYVDDEPDLLGIGKLFLEESGDFTVTTAMSAAEGILLLEQEQFDAIISDYQMPGMDGIHFLVEVRKRFGSIPFILFTGRGREEVVIQAINRGANFYLQKGGEPGSQFAEHSHKIQTAVENYQAGEKIQSLNKLYSVLSATNKAIINIRTKSAFFSEICRILVETGGFRMAWIGLADQERRTIRPIASAGYIDGYLDNINISTDDVPHGRGPTGTAFRQGKYYFSNDIASDPRMEPWRENALKRGYLANAAFPFAIGTKNAGVISLYAPFTGFFDEQIIDLLDELSVDVSFALRTLDEQDDREKAEKALKESEEKFHTLYQHMTEGAALHQLTYNDQGVPEDYVILETNYAFEKLLGISRDNVIGKTSKKAYGVAETPYLEIYSRVAVTGEPESFETYFPPLAKHFSISVYCPKKGRFATIFEDITDQKCAEEELFKKNEELNASYEQIAASEEELRGNLDELSRQEQALRESEASLRAILDATPFPVAMVDIEDNNINYWSRSALTLFGHTAPTAAEWYLLAYPDPVYRQDVIDRWKPYLEKAKLSGQPVNTGEYRVTCRDGSVRICELYATFLADKLIVTFNDITERKRVEANLRASEDAHSAMLNGITESAFMITPEGIVLAANETVAIRLGFKRADELIGKNAFELLPEDAKKNRLIKIQKVLQSGQPVQFEDVRNGRVISQTIYPVKDPDGTVSRIAIFGNDITERKQAEEVLAESEEKLRTLFEDMATGVFYQRADGTLIDANPAALSMFGLSREQFLGRDSYDPRWKVVSETGEQLSAEQHPSMIALRSGKPVKNMIFGVYNPKLDDMTWISINAEPRFRNGEITPYQVFVTMYNITELRREKEALRESEEKYRNLFVTGADGIVVHNAQGRNIDANAQACEMLGYSHDELLAMRVSDMIPPEELEQKPPRLTDVMAGQPVCYERKLRRKDGTLLDIEIRASRIAEGTVQAFWRDITERKRAEVALKESESRIRQITDTITSVFYIHDRVSNQFIYVSKAYETIWKRSCQSLIDNPYSFLEAVHPDDRQWLQESIRKELEGGIYVDTDYRIIQPDGNVHWIRSRNFPIVNETGKTFRVAGVAEDITDLKNADLSLKAAKEYAETLIQTANAMIIGLDSHGTINLFNEAAEAITGYTAAELAGRNWFEVIVPKEQYPQVWEEFNRLLAGGLPLYFENPILTKSGEERYIVWKNSEIRNNEQTVGTISFGIDITDRKRAEESLRESEKKYRSLVTTLNEGIWYVSPDLRTSYLNPRMAEMLGYTVEEMIGRPLANFVEPISMRVVEEMGERRKKGHTDQYEIFLRKKDGHKLIGRVMASPLLDEKGGFVGSVAGIEDITERKYYEDVLSLSNRIFSIANNHQQIGPMLDEIIHVIQEYTGCDSVGIRLLDTMGNIPYTTYTGFAKSFYDRESPLNINADECMCIYVIRGDANPDLPVISPKGSFWCNGTTKFLAGVSDEDKGKTRNVCNEVGYESVALVAIKRGEKILGLIHFADHREGMVPLEKVEVLEGISQVLGSAIQRLSAETVVRHALAEKEVLLREVHHRVKNNLAGILSLIELQISSLSDPQQIAHFNELENRIRSMAQVHDSLSRTKDLARINVASYTENLTRHLLPAYGNEGNVRCRIEMGDITLPIETATPLGLVMNEIVTNSLKHAFPKTFSCEEKRGEPCTITLTLHREGSDYLLGLADTGIGMPEGIDVTMSHTLGRFLIRFIVEHQLRGSVEISTARGTAYMIRFPAPPVKEGNAFE